MSYTEADRVAGIADFTGTWVDRLAVDQLGKLSSFLSKAQSRASADGDRVRQERLETLGAGVWNMWCDKQFGGIGRWPARREGLDGP